MNFCNKRKFIFIHIPRTGGGSLEKSIGLAGGNGKEWGGIKLGNYRNGHSKLSWYPHEMVMSFFKFSIIRNPWDRVFSIYKWERKNINSNDFKIWLTNRINCKDETRIWHSGFLNQIDYITYENNICIDYLMRFERLEKDFSKLKKEYPHIVVNSLPHTHKTAVLNYKNFYDEDTYNIINNLFKKDINFFDYKF